MSDTEIRCRGKSIAATPPPDNHQVDLPVADDTATGLAESVDRRTLLGHLAMIGAGGLAAAVGGGLLLQAATAVANAATGSGQKHRYGMVIDTNRCVGCKACMVACKAENKTPPGVSYTMVTSEPPEGALTDRPIFMSKPCFHCEEAPCTRACPVSATFKRAQDGIVVVDYDRCIGCRYCIRKSVV